MTTRIKVCGLTTPGQAVAAAEAGVDAIGLVFWPESSRALSPERAREIAAAVPPLVTVVGLFMNARAADVDAVLAQVPLDLLQFHGQETDAFCRAFERRYIKAIGMSGGQDPEPLAQDFPGAAGLLVDAHAGDRAGGSGESFDWSRLPRTLAARCILAGGLSPENVAEAIRTVRPWGVDVSSGVESSPGVKDSERIRRFVSEVRNVG